MSDTENFAVGRTPAEIARAMEQAGVAKAKMPLGRMMILAVMAGAFVALGAVFFLTTMTDVRIGYGAGQLLGGLAFCLGLLLVANAGAELFTGNSLMVMALAGGKISVWELARNWTVVFIGNLVGSLLVAALVDFAQHWAAAGYLVGAKALAVGAGKVSLAPGVAFSRAILCNILVCLAVWVYTGGRTVTDKVIAMILPVSAFVAAGFEHSVANMFFVPYAIMAKAQPAVVAAAGLPAGQLAKVSLQGFLGNLIPVTLGNIVGGAVFVGLAYWAAFLREQRRGEGQSKAA